MTRRYLSEYFGLIEKIQKNMRTRNNKNFCSLFIKTQASEPVEPWKPAVLDAFKYSNMCIQPIDPANKPHPQHEDCLYLNVYIPGEISL